MPKLFAAAAIAAAEKRSKKRRFFVNLLFHTYNIKKIFSFLLHLKNKENTAFIQYELIFNCFQLEPKRFKSCAVYSCNNYFLNIYRNKKKVLRISYLIVSYYF